MLNLKNCKKMEKFTEEERDEQLALYECLKDAQTELECTIERMKGKYAVLKRGIQNIAPQVQALKDLVCSEEEFKKAFDDALKSKKPAVIDAEIYIDEMVLPMIPPAAAVPLLELRP